jgi:type II secretory pathway pseudopilin PulG
MVEVMVVLIIIAIIGAIAVPAMRSSRDSGGRVELRAAATRYADAVERYQADHGRKVPVYGSADWSVPNAGPVQRLQIGTNVVRPYLSKAVPEILTRPGPVSARWSNAAPGTGTRGGRLVYVRSGSLSFRIDAYWNGVRLCQAGDIPADARPC